MTVKHGFAGVLVLALCLLFGCSEETEQSVDKAHLEANAKDLGSTVVTPHLDVPIEEGKNVLWCNTFQLAWNELCDLAGGPIEMEGGPAMVDVLNKRTASKKDLDDASYVAMAGLASDGIYDKIRDELERKFAGQATPDLLDSSPEQQWVACAYLMKNLPFEWAFERLPEGLDFQGQNVEAFGPGTSEDTNLVEQAMVLDYQDEDDFILELKTLAKDDRLILAKVPPRESLEDTIAAVEERIDGENARLFGLHVGLSSALRIPVLNFDILRDYSELCNLPIADPNGRLSDLPLGTARQSIRFRLDERGAVLESEALDDATSAGLEASFIFDKPFLILLQRRDAKNPYFALWVGNAELLVPAGKD